MLCGVNWTSNDIILVTIFCTICCLSWLFFAADDFSLQILTVRMPTANYEEQG